MSSRLFQIFVLLAVTSLVAGCKLAMIAPPGGSISSTSNTRNCDGGTEGKYCAFDLTSVSLPFSETFTATAKPGYQFVKWQAGEGFLCGNSTDPTCTVTVLNNELGIAVFASYWTGNLMPLFNNVGFDTDGDGIRDELDTDDDNDGVLDVIDECPLRGPNLNGFGCNTGDIITVDGKEWLQPKHFRNLTWSEVNAVCPQGVCEGMLNGYDVTGWTWASIEDFNSLFNSNAGSEEHLGPGPDTNFDNSILTTKTLWATAFFEDGWLPFSGSGERSVRGWLRDSTINEANGDTRGYYSYLVDAPPNTDGADIVWVIPTNIELRSEFIGVWLYRNL